MRLTSYHFFCWLSYVATVHLRCQVVIDIQINSYCQIVSCLKRSACSYSIAIVELYSYLYTLLRNYTYSIASKHVYVGRIYESCTAGFLRAGVYSLKLYSVSLISADSRAPFSADTQHIYAREAYAGNNIMSQPSAVSNSVEVKYVMSCIPS